MNFAESLGNMSSMKLIYFKNYHVDDIIIHDIIIIPRNSIVTYIILYIHGQ